MAIQRLDALDPGVFPALLPGGTGRWTGLALSACLLLAACALNPPQTVLDVNGVREPDAPARVWPAPPDVPRFQFVGDLIGEQNFVRADRDGSPSEEGFGSWMRTLWSWITGLGEVKRDPVVLQRPHSGVTDNEGRIYVTDSSRQAVFVFDTVSGQLRLWEHADEQRRFVSPVGIAADHLGRLMVTDAELAAVFRFAPDGAYLDSFGQGILKRPTGVAFDPLEQHIYVADTDANDIKVFDEEGRLFDTVGYAGEDEGRLNRPVHLTFAGGRLFVTDTLNARVQTFDREGNPLAVIGRRGLYIGNLTRPKGVAVDSEGHVYIIEGFYDHMLVFRQDGRLLMGIGGTGSRPGQFYLPAGVWTDANNRIYVADMFNGRVSIFQFLGDEP